MTDAHILWLEALAGMALGVTIIGVGAWLMGREHQRREDDRTAADAEWDAIRAAVYGPDFVAWDAQMKERR